MNCLVKSQCRFIAKSRAKTFTSWAWVILSKGLRRLTESFIRQLNWKLIIKIVEGSWKKSWSLWTGVNRARWSKSMRFKSWTVKWRFKMKWVTCHNLLPEANSIVKTFISKEYKIEKLYENDVHDFFQRNGESTNSFWESSDLKFVNNDVWIQLILLVLLIFDTS